MNRGIFGEEFPYTNFHDLNLDWIVKQLKENKEDLSKFEDELEKMGVDIEEFRQYIDNIDDEIQEKIEEELPIAIQEAVDEGALDDLVSVSHKRRIVFIGDSYGQGWTPDGTFTSWVQIVATAMGLASGDWYNSSAGGAGFGKSSSEGNQYIPTLIQNAYTNISNPETVSDVVIGVGYNDYLVYNQEVTIHNGIQSACSKSKTCFPNARIHIFAIGFTTNNAIQAKLKDVYKAYNETTADVQYYNVSRSIANSDYFSTDGIHINDSGQYALAVSILHALNNTTPSYYIGELPASSLTFQLNVGNDSQAFSGLLASTVVKNYPFLVNTVLKIITLEDNKTFDLTGNTSTKLAKLTGMGSYIGYYSRNPYEWTNGYLYYTVAGQSGFEIVPCSFTLAMDDANNDNNVYLWVRTLGVSGGGFLNISNIYRFGIQGVNMPLSFITDN